MSQSRSSRQDFGAIDKSGIVRWPLLESTSSHDILLRFTYPPAFVEQEVMRTGNKTESLRKWPNRRRFGDSKPFAPITIETTLQPVRPLARQRHFSCRNKRRAVPVPCARGFKARRTEMLTKTKLTLAVALVAASASTALADSHKRKHAPRAPANVTISYGRAEVLAPISVAERAWMDRASNPNTNGF